VIFAAGKVGGIHANSTYPAEFIFDNLVIAVNSIDAAYRSGTERFLYLGSSCIYPRMAPQPISEDSLLTGPLEQTNEAYALAKITGLKMCQYYRQQFGVLFHSAMPTNLYGPGDNYHPENSHVVPALIRRFHEAKEKCLASVTIWGTGQARRELMHVDDLASGLVHLCQLSDPPDLVNLGTGNDVTILELAQAIADVVGYRGTISTDPSKPEGTPVKRTDVSRIAATGWQAEIDLGAGLAQTYQEFLNELAAGTLRES
jgi:GDP-L-fucose synthase